jgi:hypothetical protein
LDSFFAGVSHFLKPDGVFVYTDFIEATSVAKLEDTLEKYFFISRKEDIRNNVILALTLTSDKKCEMIAQTAPWSTRMAMKTFAAVDKSMMYDKFKSKELTYFVYILTTKVKEQSHLMMQ